MLEIRVAAENGAGLGDYCSPFGPIEITDGVFPPGPPQNVKVNFVEVRKNAVPLAWSKPTLDGGSEITGYEIEKCIDGSTSYENCGKCGIETNFTVSDVREGSTYKFRVKAVNAAGVSGPSESTDNVLVEDPNDKPKAPTSVTAENPSIDSIDVWWRAGAETKIPVDNWIVEKLQHGKEVKKNEIFQKQSSKIIQNYKF